MPEVKPDARLRPLDELDIGAVVRIDERITGKYRPEFWEQRVSYYLRRDPESSQVAEVAGKVVGFMFGDIRAGEFGLESPSGWIERFGIDPEHRGRDLGNVGGADHRRDVDREPAGQSREEEARKRAGHRRPDA